MAYTAKHDVVSSAKHELVEGRQAFRHPAFGPPATIALAVHSQAPGLAEHQRTTVLEAFRPIRAQLGTRTQTYYPVRLSNSHDTRTALVTPEGEIHVFTRQAGRGRPHERHVIGQLDAAIVDALRDIHPPPRHRDLTAAQVRKLLQAHTREETHAQVRAVAQGVFSVSPGAEAPDVRALNGEDARQIARLARGLVGERSDQFRNVLRVERQARPRGAGRTPPGATRRLEELVENVNRRRAGTPEAAVPPWRQTEREGDEEDEEAEEEEHPDAHPATVARGASHADHGASHSDHGASHADHGAGHGEAHPPAKAAGGQGGAAGEEGFQVNWGGIIVFLLIAIALIAVVGSGK